MGTITGADGVDMGDTFHVRDFDSGVVTITNNGTITLGDPVGSTAGGGGSLVHAVRITETGTAAVSAINNGDIIINGDHTSPIDAVVGLQVDSTENGILENHGTITIQGNNQEINTFGIFSSGNSNTKTTNSGNH